MKTSVAVLLGAAIIAFAIWTQGFRAVEQGRCRALWKAISMQNNGLLEISVAASTPRVRPMLQATEKLMGVSLQECARSKKPIY